MKVLDSVLDSALDSSRLDTNYSKCIICHEKSNHGLVVSHIYLLKVLDSVKKCTLYGDLHFPQVSRRLQIVAEEELMASKATWHHICYQQTTNKELIRRAKERYERRKSDLVVPTSSEVTRRSFCPMYEKKNCFFVMKKVVNEILFTSLPYLMQIKI